MYMNLKIILGICLLDTSYINSLFRVSNQMSRILPLLKARLSVGGRLSVWYDSNHSIRRQVKGDTWRGHVLCTRRYQVAAKRRNERAASMAARVTVKLSRRMCVSGEAKHKSRPNCKTNTRS